MIRHFEAYGFVLLIYFIPPLISSPNGALYYVSIAAWSSISVTVYLKFIKLRCATILALIEVLIVACAMIAAIEAYIFRKAWYFYTNLESIHDLLIALEVLVITNSLVGVIIGFLGNSRYNKHNIPRFGNRGNSG